MEPVNPPKVFTQQAILGPQPFKVPTQPVKTYKHQELEEHFIQANLSSAQVKHNQDIKLVPFGDMYDPPVKVAITKEQPRVTIPAEVMNNEKYRYRYGYMVANKEMEHNKPYLYKGYSNPEQAENTQKSIGSSITPNSTYGYTGWIRENFDYAKYLTTPVPVPVAPTPLVGVKVRAPAKPKVVYRKG